MSLRPIPIAPTLVIGLQMAMALGVMALPLMPVSGQAMVVVPLHDDVHAARWITAAGGRLLAQGPWRGSYIVDAEPMAMLAPSLAHGSLLIRSDMKGCKG